MTQRTIQVADESPEAEIRIVNGQNETVENVLGGGEEYIQITVTDYDDSIDGVYGDVSIHWPGQSPVRMVQCAQRVFFFLACPLFGRI